MKEVKNTNKLSSSEKKTQESPYLYDQIETFLKASTANGIDYDSTGAHLLSICFDELKNSKEVNYGELNCVLSDYLVTDGVIILTAMGIEDIVDDILKLVNECSYPNNTGNQYEK